MVVCLFICLFVCLSVCLFVRFVLQFNPNKALNLQEVEGVSVVRPKSSRKLFAAWIQRVGEVFSCSRIVIVCCHMLHSTPMNTYSKTSLIQTPTDGQNLFVYQEFVLTEVLSIEKTL